MKLKFHNARKMAAILAITTGVFAQKTMHAQVVLSGTSYTQNFDSLANGLPVGWSVDSGVTQVTLGTPIAFSGTPDSWGNTIAGFKNVASVDGFTAFTGTTAAMQNASTNRALGLRQTSAFENSLGFVLTLANTVNRTNFSLDFDLQSLDSTSSRTTNWVVDFGTGANPTSFGFTGVAGNAVTGNNTFGKNHIHVNFSNGATNIDNVNAPVYIRIRVAAPSSGTGNRPTSAIDSVKLTYVNTPVAPAMLNVTNMTPMGANIPLATDTLTIKFDHKIKKGTGSIKLFKGGSSNVQAFVVSTAAVTVSDSTAKIAGVALQNNSHYHVAMDSAAFLDIAGALASKPITDTTYWHFSTVDTVVVPAPTLKILSMTPTGNNVPVTTSALTIKFDHRVKKATGNIKVINEATGAAQTFAVTSAGVTVADSTVTVGGLALVAGTAYHVIMDANTFADTSNVLHSVAIADTTYWKFKTATGTGFFTPSKTTLGIKVLGEATSGMINLRIDLAANANLNVQMYDLTGRVVYQQTAKGKTGSQVYTINNANIPAGMYVIRVLNGDTFGVVKVSVK